MSSGGPERLAWPDCRNVRDLGGLPTSDGGRLRAGALVRADNLGRLTQRGVAALHDHGVRRIVDLRNEAEAAAQPHAFAGTPIYRLLPLIDPAREPERDPVAERTKAATYRGSVLRNGRAIGAAIAAIADAPPGGVVVHCAAGRDRTGMLVALVLAAAGVPDDLIAEDYSYTAVCLREQHEVELAAVTNSAAREALLEQQSSPAETILGMLRVATERYGDLRRYLLGNGLTPAQFDRLLARLR
jgi:hypothetical protein